jgi:peptide/nickel transport system ATP-binding protein
MSNDKILFKIRNLKQHFPLKQRGLSVKAVDGVDVEIYKGETLGLVGESGCGKSTFGRVLLQLYRQTDGKTLYYGRSLENLSPSYVKETLNNLAKHKEHLKELDKKQKEASEYYNSIKDDTTKDNKVIFEALNNSLEAEKLYRNAYLDIVQLIGGFIIVDDEKEVVAPLMAYYNLGSQNHHTDEKLKDYKLEIAEVQRKISRTKEDNKNTASLEKKLAKLQEEESELNKKQQDILAKLKVAKDLLVEKRAAFKDNEDFQKHEQNRDDGIDLSRLTFNEMRLLRKDMQLIFQDPYSSLNPRMTVGQIIGEGLLAHRFFKADGKEMQEYVMEVMKQCGLAPYMIHRYPHQFSGGQRQRIGIARSLALNPQFMVCDEAVSALDVSIQAQIINLLKELKDNLNLTYLFISHDLAVVKYISDRIGVMYLGNIVELAPTEKIFSRTMHPYTEALLAAIPTTERKEEQDEIKLLEGDIPSPINPPSGCKFHTRCPYKTEICTHVVPVWRELEKDHYVACHHPLLGEKESDKDVIPTQD